jgi:hypothetical protein
MLQNPQCNELAITTSEILSIRAEKVFREIFSDHAGPPNPRICDKDIRTVFSSRQDLKLCFVMH